MNNNHNKYINLNEDYYKKNVLCIRKYINLKNSIIYGGSTENKDNLIINLVPEVSLK